MNETGFFGKVRTHGDFVMRRLPASFVGPWDRSLQEGMLEVRARFGAQWLQFYLNAPLWHFVLAPGLCGANAWAGVLMPGVDRVGRYFPFTIALPLERSVLARWLDGAQAWFDAMARCALSTLAPDFDLELFDMRLAALDETYGEIGAQSAPWRVESALASAGTPLGAYLAAQLAAGIAPGASAWWTEGSEAVPATLRVGAGLLDGPRFAGLLDSADGAWPRVEPLRRAGAAE